LEDQYIKVKLTAEEIEALFGDALAEGKKELSQDNEAK